VRRFAIAGIRPGSTLAIALGLTLALGCTNQRSIQEPPVIHPSTPSASPKSSDEWKTVEQLDLKSAFLKDPAELQLEIPKDYDDPGDFTRIRIRVAGQPELVLDNEDGWIKHATEQQSPFYSAMRSANLVHSERVLVLSFSTFEAPVMILRSWGYASDPERIHLIGFTRSGRPVLIFNKEFDVLRFEDIDGDGRAELIGTPCLSEALGDEVATYQPVQVYKISPEAAKPAVLSAALTRDYTLKKYDRYAGPECNGDYVAVFARGRKGHVIPEKELRQPVAVPK